MPFFKLSNSESSQLRKVEKMWTMSGQFLPSVLPATCSLRHRFWGTGKGEVRFPHPTRSIPTCADFHNSEDGRFLRFFQKAGSAIPCRGSVVSNQHGKLHSMTTLLRFFWPRQKPSTLFYMPKLGWCHNFAGGKPSWQPTFADT